MSYPAITIKNNLTETLTIYDAFQENTDNKNLTNFFGTLTNVSSVPSSGTQTFKPIHGPVSTYIIYDTNYNPVKRIFTLGNNPQTFTVEQADVEVIKTTEAFIKLIQNSPDNSEVVAFQKLIKGGNASPKQVNDFFQGTTDYKLCTFVSYMLVVITLARTPESANKPPQDQNYALSSLLKYLGIDWPEGFPDIVISDFFYGEENDILKIGGKLNINNVTFQEGVLDHVLAFLPSPEITFRVEVILKPGLSVGTTILTFTLDDVKIPIGNGKTFDIDKPTMMLSINPLFKFVVFEIKADIPFNIFNSPPFTAQVAMTIDNIEAEVGVEVTGNTSTLLTPPVIKGLHIDSFGVGLGLFFEPAGFAIGVDGKFHIGEQKERILLDDDQFAIVCQMEEEVPNPLYLSFYVPKLDIEQVVTLFTNTNYQLDIPITFEDLSFRWAENPLEPVVLPDGSLAPMGYGFSAYMNLLGLTFYGYLEIDLAKGISGEITMSPLSLGNIFKLTGDGKGVSIKIDKNGDPIQNNVIPKTAADKSAIKNAASKQIIEPGGPEMTISTSSSPYFSLDANVSLLGLINEKIDATIAKEGISFELDYGAVLETKMQCALKDYHNFSGSFSYGIDISVPFPSIAGFHLGNIKLNTGCDVDFSITTSTSDVNFKVQGGFHFEDLNLSFGPFDADVNLTSIEDFLKAIEQYILGHVEEIFADIIKDASRWANFVKQAIISGVSDVAEGLKTAFGKSADEVASIMHGAGYDINTIANGIKEAFQAPASAVAQALKQGFGATSNQVAAALKTIGFGIDQIAPALQAVFGLAPTVIKDILQGIGFTSDQIKNAFESLGGDFKEAAEKIWGAIKHWDHWN